MKWLKKLLGISDAMDAGLNPHPQIDVPGVNIIEKGTIWRHGIEEIEFLMDFRVFDALSANRFAVNGVEMKPYDRFPDWCLHWANGYSSFRMLPPYDVEVVMP